MKKTISSLIFILSFNFFTVISFYSQVKDDAESKIQFSEVSIKNVTIIRSNKKKSKKKKKENVKENKPLSNQTIYPAVVFNEKNEVVNNLTKEDFSIFENGKKQKINYFKPFNERMNIVLMIDNSNSAFFKTEMVKDTSVDLVSRIRPQDNLYVVYFDEKINLLAVPGIDIKEIVKRIKKMESGGGTSLYDAIEETLSKYLPQNDDPTAIVILTDGVDTTSRKSSFDEILDKVSKSNVVFSVIYNDTFPDFLSKENNKKILDKALADILKSGSFRIGNGRGKINNSGTTKEEYKTGVKFLNDLVSVSGGTAVKPDPTIEGLSNTFNYIYEEFQNQVLIGFEKNEEVGGEINLRINRPALTIRTKSRLIFEDE